MIVRVLKFVSKVDKQPSIITSSGASDSPTPNTQPATQVKKLRILRAMMLAEPILEIGNSIKLDTVPA